MLCIFIVYACVFFKICKTHVWSILFYPKNCLSILYYYLYEINCFHYLMYDCLLPLWAVALFPRITSIFVKILFSCIQSRQIDSTLMFVLRRLFLDRRKRERFNSKDDNLFFILNFISSDNLRLSSRCSCSVVVNHVFDQLILPCQTFFSLLQ